MRNVALAVIVLILGVAVVRGQMGGTGNAPSSAVVSDSAPGLPVNGQLWLRGTDLRQFVYSDSLGKWLGEQQVIHLNRASANHSGAWRIGETGTSPTTPFAGYDVATDSLRIMEIVAKSFDTALVAACTTFVFSDVDTILKLIWDVNEERWTPGGSGWVSAAPRVAIGSAKTISVATGAGGSVLPDLPHMWMFVRREVAP